MIEMKNNLIESCSSNLVFLRENNFQRDLVAISPQKLTSNFENAQFFWLICRDEYSSLILIILPGCHQNKLILP